MKKSIAFRIMDGAVGLSQLQAAGQGTVNESGEPMGQAIDPSRRKETGKAIKGNQGLISKVISPALQGAAWNAADLPLTLFAFRLSIYP
jgi:hypothetical protein